MGIRDEGMLNILPRISGFFIMPHLKVSYSVAVELANIAFMDGLKISREVSTQPKAAGRKSLTGVTEASAFARLDRATALICGFPRTARPRTLSETSSICLTR